MGAIRRISGLLAACAVMAASWAAFAGTISSQKFWSATLNREWAYNVYLPNGYATGKFHYPVMYLLHGSGSDENEWLTHGNLEQVVDQLINERQIPPAVIIMPSAGTSWYVDRKEMMETAFLKDLLPEVEAKFRVMTERSGRVIGGASMGGYGTLRFALKYPEMFAAAALISPAIFTPEPPKTSSVFRDGVFGSDQFDPKVWKSLNYPTLLESFFAKNIAMPIYVGSGDHDELMIESYAASFFALWRQNEQPGELRIYDGLHDFETFNKQLPEALRYIFGYVRRPANVRHSGHGPHPDATSLQVQ